MDVLIPLNIQTSWEYNEVKYCIRSLEKNLLDLDNIFIIGFLPNFLNKKIHYIPFDDPFKHNKDANIIRKVIKGISCGISENFIRISDDQLLLKPIYSKDIKPLYKFDLKEYNFTKVNKWRNRLKNTRDILIKEGKTTFNYDSHIPVVYNGKFFKDIYSKYNWAVEGEGYTINSLYFNNINCENIKMIDEKIAFETSIEKEIENEIYLGYNNKGLTDKLKLIIENLFPDKSKYED
jgi:hypothetical protein